MATITVSSEVYEEFKEAVFRKHKALHGLLKAEAEAALLAHVKALESL